MSYDSAFGQMMNSIFGSFDMSVFSVFGSIQNDLFTFLAKLFTCFGEPFFIVPVFLMSCVMILFKRTRKIGFLIVLAIIFYYLLNNLVLKEAFQRLRPYNALQSNSQYFNWYMNVGGLHESEFCFPSGHTTSVFTITTVLFLWLRFDKKKSESCLLFVIPVLVGCSRIYLMVHYPTDVVAGAFEGLILGFAIWFLVKAIIYVKNNVKILNNINRNFDFENYIKKKFNWNLNTSSAITCMVLLVFCFLIVAFMSGNIDGDKPKCQYEGNDYVCLNEGEIKILDNENGEIFNYCPLHANHE